MRICTKCDREVEEWELARLGDRYRGWCLDCDSDRKAIANAKHKALKRGADPVEAVRACLEKRRLARANKPRVRPREPDKLFDLWPARKVLATGTVIARQKCRGILGPGSEA